MICRTVLAERVFVGVLFLAGVLAGASVHLPAQEQRPPVFEAGTTLVYVDVYPRRDGRIIDGLKAEDFQVFEDGRPQKVQTFEFIRFESNPIDSDRRDPTTVADSERQAADPRNRLFVVYLDVFHTTRFGSRDARQPVLDFVHRTIGVRDLFGVMTPDTPVGALTFARRTDTLEAELSKNSGMWGLADEMRPIFPRSAVERRVVNCAELLFGGNRDTLPSVDVTIKRFREDVFYISLEGLVVRLRDLRDERKNVLLLTEGWGLLGEAPALLKREQGGIGSTRPTDTPGRPREQRFAVAHPQSLPPIGVGRGGKIVIGDPNSLVSDRSWCDNEIARLARIDFRQRFRTLVTDAGTANISFFPVDLGGLTVSGGHVETLRTLAGATGGWAAVNSNDIGAGFRQVAERVSAHYLIGYYSTNAVNDGKFRKIDVKVSQSGADVSARAGYIARPPIVRRASPVTASGAAVAVDAVAAELSRLGRLSSRQELFTYGVVDAGGVHIVAELAARDIDSGRWAKGADVTVRLGDASGSSTDATGRIEPGQRTVLVRIPLEPARVAPYHVRVRATDAQASAEDELDVFTSSTGVLGAPTVFRAAASPRAPLQAVAAFQFHRTERIHVEWPLLKPTDDRTVRLLDRRGQPLPSGSALTERTLPDGKTVAVFDIPLAGLPESDYVIEINARSGSDVDRKLVAFRVVR